MTGHRRTPACLGIAGLVAVGAMVPVVASANAHATELSAPASTAVTLATSAKKGVSTWDFSGIAIVNPQANKCLDMKDNSSADYTRIQIWTVVVCLSACPIALPERHHSALEGIHP